MGKAPAFQFYVRDWLSDPQLRMVSPATRGIWIDMLCYMWESTTRGEITGDFGSFTRMLGVTSDEFQTFIDEAEVTGFADIEIVDIKITIKNRRMVRDEVQKNGNRDRQRRFREKGGGDPDRWTSIRVQILERDEYMCAYCGRKADTVDHVFSKSKGGGEEDWNLVACCKRCNMKKGDRTLEQSNMTFWKGFDISKINNGNTNNNTKVTPPSSSSSSSSYNSKELHITSPEPETDSGPPVVIIPLLDKSEYKIYQSDVDEWKEAYPAIDIMTELHKIRQWNKSNPKNRKRPAGIRRHITGWLGKAQDKAPRVNNGNTSFDSFELGFQAAEKGFLPNPPRDVDQEKWLEGYQWQKHKTESNR